MSEVLFIVDRCNRGCTGVRYKNKGEAINDGGYMPYDERRIKLGFNFGNGTIQDLKRFARCNNADILNEYEFYNILRGLKLSESELEKHKSFINEMTR